MTAVKIKKGWIVTDENLLFESTKQTCVYKREAWARSLKNLKAIKISHQHIQTKWAEN